MNLDLIIILLVLAVLIVGIVYSIIKVNTKPHSSKKSKSGSSDPYEEDTEAAVMLVFNDQFKEELRNRGLLRFEKIISENAMFMQQDLQLITAQLNEYLKQEINKKLQEEFVNYAKSIDDAKQLAIESINKTQNVLDKERLSLSDEVKKELQQNKDVLMKNFKEHMAEIINHYLLSAMGNQIDLTDQLDFIISDLEANKDAILEDIKDGS